MLLTMLTMFTTMLWCSRRLRDKALLFSFSGVAQKELRRLQKSSGDRGLSLFPGGQALDEVIFILCPQGYAG